MTRLALTFTLLFATTTTALAEPTVEVAAPPLSSARQAAEVCEDAAASSTWTGHWVTTEWARMSVCNCEVSVGARTRFDVEAGPLWNHGHAQRVCPQVCASATWTGEWYRGRHQGGACTLEYPGHIRGSVKVMRPTPAFVEPMPVRPLRPVYFERQDRRAHRAGRVSVSFSLHR